MIVVVDVDVVVVVTVLVCVKTPDVMVCVETVVLWVAVLTTVDVVDATTLDWRVLLCVAVVVDVCDTGVASRLQADVTTAPGKVESADGVLRVDEAAWRASRSRFAAAAAETEAEAEA